MGKKSELFNILILILVGVLLMSAALLTGSADSAVKAHYIELKNGWTVTINGQKCEQTSMDSISFPVVNRGDELFLETVLPDEEIPNPIFVFKSCHSALQVMIDGDEIYSYGSNDYKKGHLVGYGYQCIDIPENYTGSTLTVHLLVSEDAAFSAFDTPKLYDANWYTKDFLYTHRVPLTINMFLIVFGICMAVTTLVLLLRLHSTQWLKLLWVSLIAFGIGCWSLCNNSLMFVFTNNLLYKVLIEYIALYALPIPMLAYFYDEAMCAKIKLRKVIYFVILAAQILFTAAAYVFQLTGIRHFPKMLPLQHILLGIIVIYLVYMFVSDFINRRLDSVVLFAGAIILIIFGSADVLKYNLIKYSVALSSGNYVGMLNIGVMIFIVAMLLDFSRSIIQALLAAARGKTLEELAFTDALTGLANKRSCEEAFDALDLEEDSAQYAIGVFDLNNLKKVNDNKGHEEGDAFICAFADVLKTVFSDLGIVGRTGGDEFMVIINDAAKADVPGLIKTMNRRLQEKNMAHADWDLSTAYGFCDNSEMPGKNAKQIYKVADDRMYECKKKMKQERAV